VQSNKTQGGNEKVIKMLLLHKEYQEFTNMNNSSATTID